MSKKKKSDPAQDPEEPDEIILPQIEIVPVDSLVLWEGNPRINDAAVEPVRRSMEYFGWTNPILVRKEDRMVIAGHTRIKAALARNQREVPVIFLDFSESDAKLYNIVDNQTAQIASWDRGKLAMAMQGLGELKMDLSLTGFDKSFIRNMLRPLGRGGDDFDVDAAAKEGEGRVQRGQIWLCGPHRVMCGDSTDPLDFAALMKGDSAASIFTDPPYGVDYLQGYQDPAFAHHRTDGKRVPNDKPGDLSLAAAFANMMAVLIPGGAYYVCSPSGSEQLAFRHGLAEWNLRQEIIWVKQAFVFGRMDYKWQHETLLYGWREGHAHRWYGPNNETTVWSIERPTVSDQHPTMKPLALVERALANSTRTDDLVLDPFLGSGTTLVAAERSTRRCYGMDIDPIYAAVAIARWEAETGETAKLAE